jgi:hypothetical protein
VDMSVTLEGPRTFPSVDYEIMTVTPDAATAWLGTTSGPHRANLRAVANYSKAMEDGSWKLNGEPIIFSNKGILLDGYARLRACTRAGKPFKTLVIRGIDSASFETIDAVRKRTLGDILHIRREPNGRALAAALMIVWRYWQGDLATQKKMPSASELLAHLDANPEIRNISLPVAKDAAPDVPLGIGTAMHHLFAAVDLDQANEFFQQFVDDVGTTPAGVLRAALRTMAEQGGRRVQPTMMAMIIKAWNAFRDQKTITLVRYNFGREKFPEISGLPLIDLANLPKGSHQIAPAAPPPGLFDHDDAMTVELLEMTPDIVADLLKHNDGNRLVADGVVAKYKRDMIAGRWLLNGQTIKIGKNGRLLDGQHRCRACLESGTPFPAIIVRNVDESVFDTFDLGGRRSFADVLKQRGERSTAALAAALRWVWMLQEGKIFDRVTVPTNAELDDIFRQNSPITESLTLANRIRNVMAPGMGVALHYLFTQKEPSAAADFFDRLCDGQNLTKDMPVWHIRERLINDRSTRKVKMGESERFILTIKAWNAMRQNKKISQLSWRGKGPSREELPEII